MPLKRTERIVVADWMLS